MIAQMYPHPKSKKTKKVFPFIPYNFAKLAKFFFFLIGIHPMQG